jgi:hypothetical protein
MTVSAKIPVSRPGGSPSGGSGAGPIAAPRVVNNRRIRTGGILLAVLLLVLGAALSGLALLSATRTSAYLAVAKQVPVGQTIQASDLKTVELSGGQGLEAIPANQISTVLGRRASTTLVPGALLAPEQLTNQPLLPTGFAEIGLSWPVSRLAAPGLKAGDKIILFPVASNGAATGDTQFAATIIDIGSADSSGSVVIHLAVDVAQAPIIFSLGSSGGLGMFQPPA